MSKSMTSGNPAKLIFFFSLPLIIGNLFQQFYNMADTLIVGRTIGVDALAAVGCTGSLNFFIIGFVTGFTSGLTIPAAQSFGAQNFKEVKRSFAAGIVLSCAVAVIMTVLALFLTRPALMLLNTPAEILDDAVSYLRIIFLGISATVLFNLVSSIMRALGDSRVPLYFLTFACCINIALDILLIRIFHMGVAGAGVATVFSQLVSGICCCFYIARKMPMLQLSREDFYLTGNDMTRHLRIALPMAFQMSIIAIGALILQVALNSLGAVSVAAYTTAQKIDTLATFPLNSLGAAMSTYSAQNYGAGKMDRVRKGVFQCILMSLAFSIIMGAVNIFFGSRLAAVFVGEAETEVLKLAQTYLIINGSMYWVLGLLFIYRFTLQGMGNGMAPTIAGTMELVMRTAAALLLTGQLGFAGAAMANPLAWIGSCIPLSIAYYHITRKKKTAVS